MAELYISVGKLGKPHGISGACRFIFQRELRSKKKFPDHLLIIEKGTYLPWFIKEVEWITFNSGFVLFEEITTPEKAKLYSGSELFLSEKNTEDFFKNDVGEYDYLIGFKASDEEAGNIGTILEMIENPGQILCAIDNDGKQVIVPFVEDFIVEIDKRKKKIMFSLPSGLLDL